MKLDRPFILLIRDNETSTILSVRQVIDPSVGDELSMAGGINGRRGRKKASSDPKNTKVLFVKLPCCESRKAKGVRDENGGGGWSRG